MPTDEARRNATAKEQRDDRTAALQSLFEKNAIDSGLAAQLIREGADASVLSQYKLSQGLKDRLLMELLQVGKGKDFNRTVLLLQNILLGNKDRSSREDLMSRGADIDAICNLKTSCGWKEVFFLATKIKSDKSPEITYDLFMLMKRPEEIDLERIQFLIEHGADFEAKFTGSNDSVLACFGEEHVKRVNSLRRELLQERHQKQSDEFMLKHMVEQLEYRKKRCEIEQSGVMPAQNTGKEDHWASSTSDFSVGSGGAEDDAAAGNVGEKNTRSKRPDDLSSSAFYAEGSILSRQPTDPEDLPKASFLPSKQVEEAAHSLKGRLNSTLGTFAAKAAKVVRSAISSVSSKWRDLVSGNSGNRDASKNADKGLKVGG